MVIELKILQGLEWDGITNMENHILYGQEYQLVYHLLDMIYKISILMM